MVSTHPYGGEDEDELSFEKGEAIAVVPFDDPEDEVCACVCVCVCTYMVQIN